MPSAGPLLGVFAALAIASLYPVFSPTVRVLWPKEFGDLNSGQCQVIPTLKSCEQVWVDQGSGLLYAACAGSPDIRAKWFPCLDHWDAAARSTKEYLAVVDTRASGSWESRTTRVQLAGFPGLFGEGSFTSHGMGVWQDEVDRERLRLFIVNHRPSIDYSTSPPSYPDNSQMGANSTIEIFETRLGSDTADHIRTVAHPLIRTPNDVEPASEDTFYVTNDHHVKSGFRKILDMLLPLGDLAYCDAQDQCKVALSGLQFANGIDAFKSVKGKQSYILSQTASPNKLILEPRGDNTLQIIDTVNVPMSSDNVYVSPKSNKAYMAMFPDALGLMSGHFKKPKTEGAKALIGVIEKRDPNQEKEAFFGNKWKVSRLFESDSTSLSTPSGMTSGTVDETTNTLFMGGVYSEDTWACKLTQAQSAELKF